MSKVKIEYCIDGCDKIRLIELSLVKCAPDEFEKSDIIKEFYKRIHRGMIGWFQIVGSEKRYELNDDTENMPHHLLYNVVIKERQLNSLEMDLRQCYKELLEDKKEYWKSLQFHMD